MAIFDKVDYIEIEPPIHVCQSIAVISYTVLQPATQMMFQLVRTTNDPETEIKSSLMLPLTLYMYVGESESLLI